ncbi:MAG: molybdopterin-dependent oxidoreductase [Armatimonadota bacterium]|nr:molybdopterin-dependent oxidoreductase [Armatimonadota bacterium]MDR7486420.1 molybdopterin-dependent oxidoreductase [Armatimonadota bacterium]MDR7532553.1 molybdopterin-dependent oxidoreductase [Armatimonadota bacterium]MDR7535558.1 molybdopterin-dependent oxidoreductase [Armatimonadota bacterium]
MAHDFSIIGRPLPRVDGPAKAAGQTRFADDLHLPRMLYGRLLRSVHAHARIVRIDTSRARALPGVLAVLTGADLPVKFGILPVSQDEHALCVDRVRFVGDPVAAVAAVDEETAERALELIDVEYDPLPAIMTIEDALRRDDVRIHDYGDGPANVHKMVALEFGDVEEGFREAAYVCEDVFYFEGSTHLPMEQHAAVASYEADGKLTVWSATQTPHYVHRALAKVLEYPPSRIRVIATPVGGGFGGKSDPFSHEIVAARLAMLTGRPVKITCTREEVFYIHRGRHPVLMWVKTGFSRDGRITAMHFKSFLDGGAYGSYGVATTYYTGALQPTTYRIPRYRFEGLRVFTNKPPCGPKRGHGTPQPRFALECHLDKAAAALGLDPVELRRRNLVEPHSMTVNHLRITSCGLRECIDRVVEASGYLARRGRLPAGRGLGFAVSAYLCGAGLPIYWNEMPQSEVQIKIDRGGGVTVYSMAIDIGQGSDSVLASTVAEVLGIEPADVALVTADTDLTPIDLGSYSSRVTFMAGNAALEAAQKMRDLVFAAVAEKLEVPAELLAARGRRIFNREKPDMGVDWPEAVRLAEARWGLLLTSGSYRAPKLAGPYKGSGVGPSPAYSYTACVVEVTCDAETGWVTVDRVWIAHDIGRAINPLLVEGQVEGSVYMALGEALMEEQVFRRGVHKFPSMLEYKSPTILETPQIHTFLVETVDPEGPFGAKEAGQGPLLPVIPAVANAVADALGVRIDEVPITPDKVLAALADRRKGGPGRVGPSGVPAVRFKDPIRVEPPAGWQRVTAP